MYKTLFILAVVLTALVIIRHQACDKGFGETSREKPLRHGFAALFYNLLLIVLGGCFLLLALTGFYPGIIAGRQITGYPLMLHVTVAPVFLIGMVVAAFVWAGRCPFGREDWLVISRMWSRRAREESEPGGGISLLRKVSFWLMLLLTIPTALTIVLSMLPLFGTHMQEFCYHAHRYVTIFLSMFGILFLYLTAFSGGVPVKKELTTDP